jgi:hypothetical protein
MTADSYEQACVSTRSGGFGIRRVADHAPAAFNASWFAGKTRCGEDWTDPVPNMTSSASSQSESSRAIDKSIMSRLLESADRRNKQRLNRLACEHANAWVTALPSEIDGKETVLPPSIYYRCMPPSRPSLS